MNTAITIRRSPKTRLLALVLMILTLMSLALPASASSKYYQIGKGKNRLLIVRRLAG